MPDGCCDRCRGKDVVMKGLFETKDDCQRYWQCVHCETFFEAEDYDNCASCDNCDDIYCYRCAPNRRYCYNCEIDWCGFCENTQTWKYNGGENGEWICGECISH